MSNPTYAGTGGPASQGPFTWGGQGPRRICDVHGNPPPKGTYGASVDAGMYMVTDDKYGTQQWVFAGEMVHWDGEPDPARVALMEAKAALVKAAKLLGFAI